MTGVDSGRRCGELCQHPGCWYTQQCTPSVYQTPYRYSQYLSEIVNSKKPRQHTKGECALIRNFVFQDNNYFLVIHESSYTVDGLPTLKVQIFNNDSIHEQKPPKTLPRTLHRKNPKSKYHNSTEPKIRYAEMKLEDEGEQDLYSSCDHSGRDDAEFTFSPLLIWKPGCSINPKLKSFISKATPKSQIIFPEIPQRTQNFVSETGLVSSIPVRKSDNSVNSTPLHVAVTGNRSPLLVRKTNLTDMLPPHKENQRNRVCSHFKA